MKLDFLICGTPNDAFCSQIAFFRLSLNHLGGIYKKARVVAVFGDHQVAEIPLKWQKYFSDIEVVWSHEVGETNEDYSAQHYKRFENMRPDADIAFICDADTVILSELTELIQIHQQQPCLAGVIAHYHFPINLTGMGPVADWAYLYDKVIGKKPKIEYRYTLLDAGAAPETPFYINYGLLSGPPAMLKLFYDKELALTDEIKKIVGGYWAAQIGVSLAVADLDLPVVALPMKYNFPNDPHADALYPEDLENIALMHYLREELFSRHEIFANKTAFDSFMTLTLAGSNRVLQEHVKSVTGGAFPFE